MMSNDEVKEEIIHNLMQELLYSKSYIMKINAAKALAEIDDERVVDILVLGLFYANTVIPEKLEFNPAIPSEHMEPLKRANEIRDVVVFSLSKIVSEGQITTREVMEKVRHIWENEAIERGLVDREKAENASLGIGKVLSEFVKERKHRLEGVVSDHKPKAPAGQKKRVFRIRRSLNV